MLGKILFNIFAAIPSTAQLADSVLKIIPFKLDSCLSKVEFYLPLS